MYKQYLHNRAQVVRSLFCYVGETPNARHQVHGGDGLSGGEVNQGLEGNTTLSLQ